MKKYKTEPFYGNPGVLSQLEKLKGLKQTIHRAKWIGEETIPYGTRGYYYEDNGKHIFRPDGGPCGYEVHISDVWIL